MEAAQYSNVVRSVDFGNRKRAPKALADAFGFEEFAVVDISNREEGKLQPTISLTSVNDEFLQTIADAGPLGACSLFDVLNITNIPFGWQVGRHPITGEPTKPGSIDHTFDLLLKEAGIGGGYCVPVHSPGQKRSVVIYLHEFSQELLRYPDLVFETIEYFQLAFCRDTSGKSPIYVELSFVELVCLEALAKGKSREQVATSLELDEVTVAGYVSSACNKMGCDDYSAAISMAKYFGWI